MHHCIFLNPYHAEPLSKILSIGTAVPAFCHQQMDILGFMQTVFALPETEKRKMRFLYQHSGINQRYSVLPDYSKAAGEWIFYPQTENLEPFPSLEHRMKVYREEAPGLSVKAIRDCLQGDDQIQQITHLITVSCTGMSAPGLDLQIMELLDLDRTISRSSVNFMGCYAAIHALKMADAFCKADTGARVLIVCTELCTLHFQRDANMDNITSSLLFGDGAAAVLVGASSIEEKGIYLDGFYSEVMSKGKQDMAWELSSTGFLMTLSGYIPELIEADFAQIVDKALQKEKRHRESISHWCIHPGGKRILEAIHKSLGFSNGQLDASYEILRDYGNLSSATILFVLKEMMEKDEPIPGLFAAAFGPGLTIETFTAHS